MKWWKLKIIDYYIIRKFLGTFFFAIVLIICIAVIFDVAEKIDDFLEKGATLKLIIFNYYLNFIPYFAVLFSSLFTFISVIFFTSKMAYNTEIVAILNSGMSFRRLMYPFLISAALISIFSFTLSNFVLPGANKKRLAFEEVYIRKPSPYLKHNIHKQIEPGVYIYLESFNNTSETGRLFSMEKFKDDKLLKKLMADYISWDSIKHKWTVHNYYIRTIDSLKEKLVKGDKLDTTINNVNPEEFKRRENFVDAMSIGELNKYIKTLKLQGADDINMYIIEREKRTAFPFSTFILTMIGVTLSSRKVRGGIGMHIGVGLALSFGYILFMQFSSQFAISGKLSPFLAAWIPNIIFAFISLYLYRIAPK